MFSAGSQRILKGFSVGSQRVLIMFTAGSQKAPSRGLVKSKVINSLNLLHSYHYSYVPNKRGALNKRGGLMNFTTHSKILIKVNNKGRV